MFEEIFTVNLKNDKDHNRQGFVADKGLFLIYELAENVNAEPLHSINPAIKEALEQVEIDSLKAFSTFIKTSIEQKYALKSYVAAYRYNSRLFVQKKHGQIFLLRKKTIYREAPGNLFEGEVFGNDILILLANEALEKSPEINFEELAKSTDIDSIKDNLTAKTNPGILVVKISAELPSTKELFFKEEAASNTNYTTGQSRLTKTVNKRWVIKAVALLLVLFLLFKTLQIAKQQYSKHQNRIFAEKIETINKEIDQMKNNGLENPKELTEKSIQLKKEIEQLKKTYPEKNSIILKLSNDIDELNKLTGAAETEKGEVYFDLSLLSNNLKITSVAFNDNFLSVLDTKNKKAFLVNLDNKSYDTFNLNNLNTASIINSYDNEVFVYDKNNGIYKSNAGKLEKIISKSKNWKNIIDLKVFNGNIYSLDQESDEIYKYVPTEGGYSSAISYFQTGESINLDTATNFAIDYSVYILTTQDLWKFTSGAKEAFDIKIDFNKNRLTKVYKSAGTKYLYLLDTKSGRIVVVNEKGAIVKSIFNNKLKTTEYFGIIDDEQVLFLHQNQIHQLDSL